MSGIRGKDTKPEVAVRRLLHAVGFRFRLHRKDLPGKPDLVLPKHRVAIFVHGCFWHGHESCDLFRLPKSRTDFWAKKISSNRARDKRNQLQLLEEGWRIIEVWECAINKARRLSDEDLQSALTSAIISDIQRSVIRAPL